MANERYRWVGAKAPAEHMLANVIPIASLDSYIGYEHVRYLGDIVDVERIVSGRLFGSLVDPVTSAKYWRGKGHMLDLGLVVAYRPDTNLGAIPTALKSKSSTPSNIYAIQAGSFVDLAQDETRMERVGLVQGMGPGCIEAFIKIAAELPARIVTVQPE
jgi:hypothetical protein